ncbi:MAG: trimeric intracellular cation channel family protein [Lachnospiraceae bacterium]|jgi:uncharacterized membrane protein YeiH|nr:trimeric intracellular cation channel family protein [Lachnospiraceae bacterium]RKJ51836.1 trimeric intracellular cation channel family protein [bacterium 1XD42-54]
MVYSDMIVFAMEIIGTVAFAASGAMTGIQRRMDLFGVNVLGVTTAVGGGLIRDLILGINPPVMFQNPQYALTAVLTSTILFLFLYVRTEGGSGKYGRTRELLLLTGDTIGLGIFTVVGVHTAITAGYGGDRFLLIFVGVMTGVGGGVIRDVLAGNTPYIFVKHVYAVASLTGALFYVALLPYLGGLSCMLMGAAAVMLIRFLAAHYRWNLPRIR